MKRRLLNLLTAGSLLLAASCVAMWVRSYAVTEMWLFEDRYEQASLEEPLPSPSGMRWVRHSLIGSGDGYFVWRDCKQWHHDPPPNMAPHMVQRFFPPVPIGYRGDIKSIPRRPNSATGAVIHRVYVPGALEVYWSRGQFIRLEAPPLYFGRQWVVSVSWWLVALVACVLPTVRGVRAWARARRRAALGRCARCGYDLRATPERCPECGTAAGTAGAA
jgi:hypothetical protein